MVRNVKRILSAVIAGALLCTGTVFSTVSAEETAVFGDLNSDGAVDYRDALIVLHCYNRMMLEDEQALQEYLDEKGIEDVAICDISGDGTVDHIDARCLLKYYAIEILPQLDLTPEEIWEQTFEHFGVTK